MHKMNEKLLEKRAEKILSDKTRTTSTEHALMNQQNVLLLHVSCSLVLLLILMQAFVCVCVSVRVTACMVESRVCMRARATVPRVVSVYRPLAAVYLFDIFILNRRC